MEDLIKIKHLAAYFQTDEDVVCAIQDVSFSIPKGKTVGLVGESGSGKSVTALSIISLVPQPPGKISGEIFFKDTNLIPLAEKQMQKIRGKKIAMIFQDPMSSLNPVFTIGNQIAEALMLHQNMNKKEALEESINLLKQVDIHEADRKVHYYPHQLSGGQRQRVMIAIALACQPELLIADEATTALDVTVQKQIIELLISLQKQYNMSILFISHDLNLVAEISDLVLVMRHGQIVEHNTADKIFKDAKHPYTKGLIACRPEANITHFRLPVMSDFIDAKTGKAISKNNLASVKKKTPKDLSKSETLLEIKNVKKHFITKRSLFGAPLAVTKAIDGVSFTVKKGETLGLVGESGCGKTTLGRSILRLLDINDGEILYRGKNINTFSKKDLSHFRKSMQIIFQDPYTSLNPRLTVEASLMEPLIINKLGKDTKDKRNRVKQLLEKVGLSPSMKNRYPHEFSGGQRQRICIARAIAVEPEFIVCDECVSALDVSIQSQIINLLLDLQDEMGLTYIFISHDLAVVQYISDAVCVMKAGKIVEKNSARNIYQHPQNDYTKRLLSSIPKGIAKTS